MVRCRAISLLLRKCGHACGTSVVLFFCSIYFWLVMKNGLVCREQTLSELRYDVVFRLSEGLIGKVFSATARKENHPTLFRMR